MKGSEIEGDLTVGRNVTMGGNLLAQGGGHFKQNVKIDGWLDAKNIKDANKGLFASLEKLQEAYRDPLPGWWAIVGNTIPGYIYKVEDGEWKNTGNIGGGGDGTVDVSSIIEELEEEVARAKDAEEELLKRVQGTSSNSDSRLDPYRVLSPTTDKGYDSYDALNAALNSLLHDTSVVGRNYGYFRAKVSHRDIEIQNILLSSSSQNIVQVVKGAVKISNKAITNDDSGEYSILYRHHLSSTGWGEWKEYAGTSSGGSSSDGDIDLSDYVTKTEFEVLNREVVKTIQINGVAKGPEDGSGDGFVDLGYITGGDGSIDEAIAEQVTQNTANIEKLMKEIFPLTVSLSVSPSSVEYGTSREFTISWTTKVAGAEVTPTSLELSIGGAVVPDVATSAKSYKWTASSSQTVSLKVTYDGVTVTKTASISFIYPAYMGVVASNFVVSAGNITSLNKLSLSSSKSRTQTFDAVKLQKIVYAYAKSYGALTGIVDGNNINLIDNYTRSEITINGIAYYVYITTEAFSTTGSFTYNFK